MMSSDFVAEIKPRSSFSQRYTAMQKHDEFIAEIKPKSYDNAELKHVAGHDCSLDASDLYLQKILTDRHFSRERITNLLEGSVITLVEKLLTGKVIARIEGTLCISMHSNESPMIVDLHKDFPKPCNTSRLIDQALDTHLNIKIKDRDILSVCPPCEKPVNSCSPSYEFDRDPCHSPVGTDNSPHVSVGPHSDSCMPSQPPKSQISSPTQNSHISSPTQDSHISSPTLDRHISSPTLDTHIFSPSQDRNISSPTHGSHLLSPTHSTHSNSSSPNPEAGDAEQMQLLHSNIVCDKQTNGDSDEESGYLSNEKDELDTSGNISKNATNIDHLKSQSKFNDYFCNGFDGKKTLFIPAVSPVSDISMNQHDFDSCGSSVEGNDEMDQDDDDVDPEGQLVIDENPVKDVRTIEADHICNVEPEGFRDHGRSDLRKISDCTDFNEQNPKCSPLLEDGAQESMTVEREDTDSSISSDITDTESQVDLPGNSEISSDIASVIPHPQGIVVKTPGGFKCKQCFIILPDTSAVTNHVQSDHGLYCCTYCWRTFTAKNNLKRHVRRHTGQRPYKCTQCSQSFFRRDDLKVHMIRHDYSKPFRCSLCKKGYTDRACVKNHMAKEHRSRLMHVCPQCGESFDNEDAFTTHKRSHPELQQFSCSTCSFIGTSNLMTLKHSLLHSHKLFSCKPCNAYFADPFHYMNHVRKHKKNESFTQYVCCFCDVALASYEQYVRHEYSHAQSKTHTCKVCKKQFRCKSLLLDHINTHKTPDPDKSEVEHSELMETDKAHLLHCQTNIVKQNHFLNTDAALMSISTDEFTRQSSDSETQVPLPATLEENEGDELYGQLLDLSMKKPSSPTFSKDDSSDGQKKNGNFSSSLRAAGQPVDNCSRNGTVSSGPINLSQEAEVIERCYAKKSLTESHNENMYKPVFLLKDQKFIHNLMLFKNRSSHEIIESSIQIPSKNRDNYISQKLETPNRLQCTEMADTTSDVPNAISEGRALQRDILINTKGRPLRFSPYYREKMADLAAKFMVARGPKLVGHRGPIKATFAAGEERKALMIREQNIGQKKQPSLALASVLQPICEDGSAENGRRDMAGQTQKDNDKVVREHSNLGTTLRCHIPTVVKSEPLLDQEEVADCPLDCRFQKAKPEDSAMNESGYFCEICREMFGSFVELENHSVETHKRYLCEHCKKSFTARPNRDRHVRYHTGERPYRCDLCDMAFFRGDDLKYHRTTRHPTAQPFVCTRCSASFTWGRDLERHIRHSKCKV